MYIFYYIHNFYFYIMYILCLLHYHRNSEARVYDGFSKQILKSLRIMTGMLERMTGARSRHLQK